MPLVPLVLQVQLALRVRLLVQPARRALLGQQRYQMDFTNGVYSYKFTYLTPSGETLPSTATANVTVVNAAANGQVNVFIPLYGQEGTFPDSINIYRTVAGGSTYKLVTNSDFFTNPYVDNTADASLGVNAPSVSTAIEQAYSISGDGVFTPPFSATAFNQNVLRLGSPTGNSVQIVPAIIPTFDGIGLTIFGGFPASDGPFQGGGTVSISGGLAGLGGDGGNLILAAGSQGGGGNDGQLTLGDGQGNVKLKINAAGQLLLVGLPSSASGLPTGALYQTAGAVMIVL